ncbi:phosphatase PAP2 family protein [Shinella curvata]|uniref:Phosphatase PAP2 family protein n=1 Tax=Shinella curvata TaxID=1817964 RepID=A0ABT8XKS9_9HYPH|nr:phosphatase PAP2 family protein [Shinella curvata]MCJ8056468.1 phosphatase PAP2 family protein [Shinella curvata]MDO6124346.1 phosphatase PAP2 family protein [Shinella curvata]
MNRSLATSSLWILAATAVLVVVLLPFDPAISQRAQGLPGAVVTFNQRITDFGTFSWMIYGSGFLVILAYVAHRISRNETLTGQTRTAWRLPLYFFVTTGATTSLVHLIKLIVGRARPELFADHGAYSLTPFAYHDLYSSFPSGHSAAVGAFFGAFSMLVPRLRPLFLLGALVIGLSRIIVGAHYPSDVAAGLLLGLWTAIATAFVFAHRDWLFRFDARGWPLPKSMLPKP